MIAPKTVTWRCLACGYTEAGSSDKTPAPTCPIDKEKLVILPMDVDTEQLHNLIEKGIDWSTSKRISQRIADVVSKEMTETVSLAEIMVALFIIVAYTDKMSDLAAPYRPHSLNRALNAIYDVLEECGFEGLRPT